MVFPLQTFHWESVCFTLLKPFCERSICRILHSLHAMLLSSLVTTVLASSLVSAKSCKDVTVQLNLTARTAVYDIPILVSDSDATTFVQNLTQQGQNFSEIALSGYQTTAGSYGISTQFCTPSGNLPQNPTVQILTHGVGFDKR